MVRPMDVAFDGGKQIGDKREVAPACEPDLYVVTAGDGFGETGNDVVVADTILGDKDADIGGGVHKERNQAAGMRAFNRPANSA